MASLHPAWPLWPLGSAAWLGLKMRLIPGKWQVFHRPDNDDWVMDLWEPKKVVWKFGTSPNFPNPMDSSCETIPADHWCRCYPLDCCNGFLPPYSKVGIPCWKESTNWTINAPIEIHSVNCFKLKMGFEIPIVNSEFHFFFLGGVGY